MGTYNEPVAAVLVGLLLSLSAGVRITLPLLAINLLAYSHTVVLPANLHWLGTGPTLIILGAATVAETLIHLTPVAGTYLRAAATPLAFVAGTLIMSVPLADQNPIYRWTLAAVLGGGLSALTSLGLAGGRLLTTPAEVATAGIFSILWNIGEMILSVVLILLGLVVLFAGVALGLIVFLGVCGAIFGLGVQLVQRWRQRRSAAAVTRLATP